VGSETLSSKHVEGAKRECIKCGRPIKNLQRDVGEVRTRFPGAVREIICTVCTKDRVARLITETRRALEERKVHDQ
jgi:hypothetical protein